MDKNNMKKFVYAILMAVLPVLAFSLASCDDDDDLPDVNITIDVDNASIVDGTIYVVQGDTLNVTAINIKNNEAGKAAALTNVRYFFDGLFIGESILAPFPAFNLTGDETPVGKYNLGISCTVLAVDKSVAQGLLSYPIKVVASADEVPDSGTSSDTRTVSMK